MAHDPTRRIAKLQAAAEPLSPTDIMAEAGRKVLLAELIKVLQHEAGSRTGVDPEDVHLMRVASRRIRTSLRLLQPFFKKRLVRRFARQLGDLAGALGEVRDLDVMLVNIYAYQDKLKAKKQQPLKEAINELEHQRLLMRQEWVAVLDSRAYQRFIKIFARFLTTPGSGVQPPKLGKFAPQEIRHLLPGMVYEHVAAVRAYQPALEEADAATFHALRIELKRLRYTVSLFAELLSKPITSYIDEIKALQDCLGEMNDCRTAHDRLTDLPDDIQTDALAAYLNYLVAHETALRSQFYELWESFNSRRVQQHLASGLLGLH